MIAVAGGLGAALSFAIATLCATRASRLIGATSVLAWVAIVGLAVSCVGASVSRPTPTLSQSTWLAVAGIGNVVGLLFVYRAVRSGKIGVVASIASTEGAVAATIAAVQGERLSAIAFIALGTVTCGVICVAWPADRVRPGSTAGTTGVALALCAALVLGVSVYAAGHVASLPLSWVVVPSRIAGAVFVALPLAIGRRLRLTRSSAWLVATAGMCEVVGTASYTLGARHQIAVSAVLASLFAAMAAIGAHFLFGERLGYLARAGILTVAIGVGALAVVH